MPENKWTGTPQFPKVLLSEGSSPPLLKESLDTTVAFLMFLRYTHEKGQFRAHLHLLENRESS